MGKKETKTKQKKENKKTKKEQKDKKDNKAKKDENEEKEKTPSWWTSTTAYAWPKTSWWTKPTRSWRSQYQYDADDAYWKHRTREDS